MRAFAVGAGQTPDFGRSPRAVPLGSLDIFAGPVTPRDLVTWASLSRGPPGATTRERRTRRMALRADAERRRKRLGTSTAARNEPF